MSNVWDEVPDWGGVGALRLDRRGTLGASVWELHPGGVDVVPDVSEYPDVGKIGVRVDGDEWRLFRPSDAVDYYDTDPSGRDSGPT